MGSGDIGHRGRLYFAAVPLIALGVLLALAAAMEWRVGVRAERVSDLVRPELTDEGLISHRQDFEATERALYALRDEVLPTIAESLGMSASQFDLQVSASYPAAGRLLDEVDEMLPFAEQVIINLEKNQDQFHSADDFPVAGVPSYGLAFLDIALAAVLILAGVALWRNQGVYSRNRALAACVVVAVVLVVVPVILRIPAKSAAGQVVLDSLNPSPEVVTRTEETFSTAKDGLAEFQGVLLPDLAIALGTTPSALQDAITSEFPATADALDDLPGLTSRYETRVAIRSNGAEEIRSLKDVPVRELGWFGPVFGVAVLVAAGVAFVASKPTGSPETRPVERSQA